MESKKLSLFEIIKIKFWNGRSEDSVEGKTGISVYP